MTRKIGIVGLGYVGLPLAIAFGKKVKTVVGFDKNIKRVNDLHKFYDKNNDISHRELETTTVRFTHDVKDLKDCNFYIISVPTPVTNSKQPDFSYLISASETVAKQLKSGDIVVYESTVYPGATEEVCLPVLEKISKLKGGKDFTIGYSPERITPGEKEHVLSKIPKIVSGQDEKTLEIVANIYKLVVPAGIYKAKSIKIAEAAKVIENTQRDLNISLINEIALILHRLGIDTLDVLDAAATKWSFLPFKPGLVGGHCISVDPYYLTYKALEVGYYPDVILAGRRVNDLMGKFIAEQTIKKLIQIGVPVKRARIAVLGFTFKENCPDTRNTRVYELIEELKSYGTDVFVIDPIASAHEVKEEYDITLTTWDKLEDMDAIILAVAHKEFIEGGSKILINKLNNKGLIVDVKGILDRQDFAGVGTILWRL